MATNSAAVVTEANLKKETKRSIWIIHYTMPKPFTTIDGLHFIFLAF
jgi:hypothetical protein